MRSSEGRRYIYEKNQLMEVICQLRFPTILAIDAKPPADFQETVRGQLPGYAYQDEKQADGSTVRNHSFVSEDGTFKMNLTQSFVSFSTMRYPGWEEFAGLLDEPLGQFIRIYRPAYFERAGLRYFNGVSRKALGLEDRRWNDLFQPQYLGPLDDDGVPEERVSRCSVDVEMALDDRAYVKLHAGPGQIRRAIRTKAGLQAVQEPENRFIFDQDLFVPGKIRLQEVMDTLNLLHSHGDRLFSEAITDVLHEAMEAVEI